MKMQNIDKMGVFMGSGQSFLRNAVHLFTSGSRPWGYTSADSFVKNHEP
jgi:hypothetical protein